MLGGAEKRAEILCPYDRCMPSQIITCAIGVGWEVLGPPYRA